MKDVCAEVDSCAEVLKAYRAASVDVADAVAQATMLDKFVPPLTGAQQNLQTAMQTLIAETQEKEQEAKEEVYSALEDIDIGGIKLKLDFPIYMAVCGNFTTVRALADVLVNLF